MIRRLTLDEASRLGRIIEDIKQMHSLLQRIGIINLIKIKTKACQDEQFELLADIKRVEDAHEFNIPFVYQGEIIGQN